MDKYPREGDLLRVIEEFLEDYEPYLQKQSLTTATLRCLNQKHTKYQDEV